MFVAVIEIAEVGKADYSNEPVGDRGAMKELNYWVGLRNYCEEQVRQWQEILEESDDK